MTALSKAEQIELAWALNTRRGAQETKTALRWRLAEAQNWRCCYKGCHLDPVDLRGPQAPTFEHIIPRSRGGGDHENNFAIACARCNLERGVEMWPIHHQALALIGVDLAA